MDWKDIPSEFRFLLDEIQKTCPEAIIAGGAMRDWFHGHTPKDVDIFVSNGFVVDKVPKLIVNSMDDPSGELDDTITQSITYGGYTLPINIVWCNKNIKPMERFERFDFGLCKIAWDGQKVIEHPEFLWDVKYNLITLRRATSIETLLLSLKRYQRFVVKYPYPLMVPHTLKLPLEGI